MEQLASCGWAVQSDECGGNNKRRLGGQRVKVLSSTIGEGMKIAIRDE